MTLLERYILKITFNAFAACLIALTGVIWITQALRELDLLTGKGQTLLIFMTVTGLSLPALVSVISPVALFLATIYTQNHYPVDSIAGLVWALGLQLVVLPAVRSSCDRQPVPVLPVRASGVPEPITGGGL